MWIGVPFTSYKYHFKVPIIYQFCVLTGILYFVLTLPETNKFIGARIGLIKYDDAKSDDRYYLVLLHTIVFVLCIFLLVKFYYPRNKISNIISTPKIITQNKILPKV
jgi:hypothetical protein